jgi:hypothetical protein
MIITSHMQNIIQIYPCLLKLSRKQESVTDGRTDCPYYYISHRYRGGYKCWVAFDHKCRSPLYRYHYAYKLEVQELPTIREQLGSSPMFALGPCRSSC